ncbi:hypothetical protein ACIBCN_19925 [Nocardia sp. NPDC051052]|uniref:hypothetical protein n=1 Tax=Nocardia sp. NPDC051052 TaxID=3364322 RepID=UPI0037BA906E
MAEDWSADEAELAEDLERAIITGLWAIGDWALYPKLCAAAGLSDALDVTPDALRVFLQGKLEAVQPDETQLRIGMLLGLVRGLWGKPLDNRRTAVSKAFGEEGPKSAALTGRKKRRNKQAKLALAREILSKRQPTRTGTDKLPFYARPIEQGELLKWTGGNDRIALLAGDSGNGKSSIAIKIFEQVDESLTMRKVAVDASTRDSQIKSINKYVDSDPDVSLSELQQRFATYLKKLPPRSILLIDNAPDWEAIEVLVLWSHRTIVTAEDENIIPSDFGRTLIRVGPLSLESATQLVKWFRRRADIAEAEHFAEAVNRNPRIIVDCLGMFSEEDMSLEDMSEVVEDDAGAMLETAGTHTRSVHKLYGIYFRQTLKDDPVVRWCIAILAHLNQSVLSKSIAAKTAQEFSSMQDKGKVIHAASVAVPLTTLKSRFLLELTRDDIYMHGVTMRLFRKVTEDYRLNVYMAVVSRYVSDHSRSLATLDEILPGEAILWMPTLMRVVLNVTSDDLSGWFSKDFVFILGELRRGFTQRGEYIYVQHALEHFIKNKSFSFVEDSHPDAEIDEWYMSAYEFGFFSRSTIIKMFENYPTTPGAIRNFSHLVQINWLLARASYGIDDFKVGFEDELREPMELTEVEWGDRLYIGEIHGRCLEYLGHLHTARRIVFDIISHAQVSTTHAIDSARLGAKCACLVGDPPGAENYFMIAHLRYGAAISARCLTRTAEANYLIASGWFQRAAGQTDLKEMQKARDSFFHGAYALYQSGMRRDAFAAYIEAVALDEWLKLAGVQADGWTESAMHNFLTDLHNEVDEPHLTNRRELISAIAAGITSGFDQSAIATISGIMVRASSDFSDIRTASQAAATILHIVEVLGEAPRLELYKSVFLTTMRKWGIQEYDQAERQKFELWVDHLIREDPKSLLLL